MDKFCKNKKMMAHCQGYYRDTVKYPVGAYLHNDMVEKAASQWNILNHRIENYIQYCAIVNAMDKTEIVKLYCEKSASNMAYYIVEYADSKIK